MKRWIVLGLLLITGLITFFVGEWRKPATPDTDKRIDFYKSHLGGPGSYPAYARLGMAYLQKSRETGNPTYLSKAQDSLQESMKFQPNFEAIRALAFLSMEKHEFRAALQYAGEALDTVPSDLETKGLLSDAYWALRDRENAMKLVQEMLVAGENFAALSRLAVIRFADGDTPAAIESMRRACSLADKESRPLDNRAWCQTRLGTYFVAVCDFKSAEEAYQRAASYLPDYPYTIRETRALRELETRKCGSKAF